MYRTAVVIRAALPMAALNVLLWVVLRRETEAGWILYFAMLPIAYCGGAFAALKTAAAWREIVLGFLLALLPLMVVEPALVFDSLVMGGAGLFLLPQLCSAVRKSDEAAKLPRREVLAVALGFLAVLMLIGTRYMAFPKALLWAFLVNYQCFLPVAVVAGSLSVSRSHSRAGAWVGAVGAVALWVSFALAFLALPLLR